MEKTYVMDNRLCDGLTPADNEKLNLLKTQKFLRASAPGRQTVIDCLRELAYAIQSHVPIEQFAEFANQYAEHTVKWIMNNTELPKVYKLNFQVYDDILEGPDFEFNLELSNGDFTISGLSSTLYHVLEGTYLVRVTAEGFEPVTMTLNTNDLSGPGGQYIIPIYMTLIA